MRLGPLAAVRRCAAGPSHYRWRPRGFATRVASAIGSRVAASARRYRRQAVAQGDAAQRTTRLDRWRVGGVGRGGRAVRGAPFSVTDPPPRRRMRRRPQVADASSVRVECSRPRSPASKTPSVTPYHSGGPGYRRRRGRRSAASSHRAAQFAQPEPTRGIARQYAPGAGSGAVAASAAPAAATTARRRRPDDNGQRRRHCQSVPTAAQRSRRATVAACRAAAVLQPGRDQCQLRQWLRIRPRSIRSNRACRKKHVQADGRAESTAAPEVGPCLTACRTATRMYPRSQQVLRGRIHL